MLVLVPIGIALFIAPLVSTHKRMLDAKRDEKTWAAKQLSELLRSVQETSENDNSNIIRLLILEIVERKVDCIKTWPIDSPLIGKLTIIASSVTIALIVQVILNFIHI